eukprot:8992401-Ditylum_brightwellii.AAC.1
MEFSPDMGGSQMVKPFGRTNYYTNCKCCHHYNLRRYCPKKEKQYPHHQARKDTCVTSYSK